MISHLSLKIDDAVASENVMADLVEVAVDHSLHLPSMFTLRLYSHDMKWLEDATFREGTKVEILAGAPGKKLLAGRIASLEPQLDQESPALVVRGYDLSHKLYRGRWRRSFNQVTDTDLVKKLAAEAGLTLGQVEDTSEVHEYVFQNNQTNAEFLLERARRLGYELWVTDEKTLHFRKPAPNGAAVALEWGKTLRSFRPCLSTAEQVNEVEVRGWDPRQKRAVTGRATRCQPAAEIGIEQPGADIARKAWGEAKIAVVDEFVRSTCRGRSPGPGRAGSVGRGLHRGGGRVRRQPRNRAGPTG